MNTSRIVIRTLLVFIGIAAALMLLAVGAFFSAHRLAGN